MNIELIQEFDNWLNETFKRIRETLMPECPKSNKGACPIHHVELEKQHGTIPPYGTGYYLLCYEGVMEVYSPSGDISDTKCDVVYDFKEGEMDVYDTGIQ